MSGRRSLGRPQRGGALDCCAVAALPLDAAPATLRPASAGFASLSMSVATGGVKRRQPAPLMTLAAAAKPAPPAAAKAKPNPLSLLVRRPLALLSLVPTELAMFVAGGVAGAIAKTTTAPLDRVRAAAALFALLRPHALCACAVTAPPQLVGCHTRRCHATHGC
jgi:hypothetical protein